MGTEQVFGTIDILLKYEKSLPLLKELLERI
jgi:hypothetical protein